MLKRVLIWLILVIILVSLHWFKTAIAQDLSDLTESEKTYLLNLYNTGGTAPPSGSQVYHSPQLRGPEQAPVRELPATGANSPGAMAEDSITHLVNEGADLVPFDRLEPFGLAFFERNTDLDPPADIASAADYILGPGDQLILYLWGRVDKEYNLVIDREGKVFAPTVGEIVAWGLSLEQFVERARTRFSKVYSDFEITCSLGKIRSIRVYVTGEVERPGAYTVSSLTSLFNALYVAGGPNQRGSMRGIKLIRVGKTEAVVDLYRFLLEGDNSTDIKLRNGDVIFVPVAGPRVAVRGRVNRQAWYELLGSETASEVLSLAGNASAEAYLNRVMLERISGRDQWEVIDLNLSGDSSSENTNEQLTMLDGDRLTIYSIFEAKKNMVALFGQVKHPGYYERNDSTRVSDLINQGQLQTYDVYFERADLFRRHRDWRSEIIPLDLKSILNGDETADVLLTDRDSIHIYSIDNVQWERKVYIEGEVKKAGWYPLYDDMSVADLIFLAGFYTRSASLARAELARIDSIGGVSLTYLDLDNNSAHQTLLREDDRLFVRRIPNWQQDRSITVEGEVLYPGEYILSEDNESLYQVLQRSGGFTEKAFPRGLILERASIKDYLKRARVNELLMKSRPLVQDSTGEVKRQATPVVTATSINRIVIDTHILLTTGGREGDIILEPGDRIYVPPIPSGISVMGAVGADGTIRFTEREDVRYYVKQAGNFTHNADEGATRLIRASGEVLSDGVLGQRVELGDIIVVPQKIERDRDWGKTVATALSMVTGLLTSVFIVSNL